mmetsp:Transcript_2966/g.5186  ORF Transcript_2966/g.5186 Transcript_2966/m.5186 type:complete len:210 (-) Transcript_2966:197-826(-)
MSAHHLILAKPSNLSCLLVPLINKPFRIDTKDRCIGCINQLRQVIRDCLGLLLGNLTLSDVLSYTHDTTHIARGITACGGIQQHLHSQPFLGVQRELEVRCFNTVQRIVKNKLHRITELWADELSNKIMAHHFILRTPSDLRSLLVPLIDTSVGVDTKNGGIGCINQLTQIIGNSSKLKLCLFLFSDVLTYSHNTHKLAVGINTWSCIQ